MSAVSAVTAITETKPIAEPGAGFIVANRHTDIAPEVACCAKRSVLGGIGLAPAGANSECGHVARRNLEALAIASDKGASAIGTPLHRV